MATKNAGLGKGFDALLPQDFDESLLLDKSERVQKISLSKLKRASNQPRKSFDYKSIQELANSIKIHGVLQPIIVSPSGDEYVIVAGERRFRAAKLAGLESVPAIIRTAKDLERLEIALVENLQRVDLSPLEEATSLQRLHDQFNLDYSYIAKELGKGASTVTNMVRLLQLPKSVKDALTSNEISEGHAKALLSLNGEPEHQSVLLENIKKNDWSVRRAEQFVVGLKSGKHNIETIKQHMKVETNETKALGQKISAPVTIRRTANGGKLEIGFKTDNDLERIISLLS